MKKYRVIDAWKGIFCILIFFEHFGICGLDGNTGYDVVECFFVISGFLLAKSIDARKGDFDILPYIFHKIKGIYPMYLWGMILMFFYQLLPFCSEEFPSFYQIITELLLLQKSGLGVGNILNGADWYVSAYILSSAVILLGMKAVQNYYLRAAVSAAVVLHYLTYMIQFGNYNDAYAFGLLDGQLVRGIACMLIGIGTYQIYGLLSNHKVRVNQGIINLLEMILAFSFFLCIFDRSIEMVNVKILFIVVGLIVCAAYECGFVSKLISRGGGLWKLSTAVYLTHLFSGNVFNGVFQWVNFKRELYVLAITVWVFVFAYISKVITERYFHMESIKNFAVSIKHLWDGNGKYVAVFAYVIVCFCLQGANAWAEVVAEYMPYANGASFQSSFAGYITLFPVIVAVIWNQIVSGTGIPYVVFTCMVSLLYTLLCVYAVLKVLKGKNENRIMVLLPLLAVISHPSVQSIINITHLGYLPLAVHIFCCAKQEHMPDEIVDISGGGILYLVLILALISKPSLLFPLFIFVIFTTKLYKNRCQLIFIVLAVIASIVQTLLFSSSGNALHVSSITGIIKAGITFIQSIGASVLFNFAGFLEHFQNLSVLMFLSFLCGGIMIGAFIFRVFHDRTYQAVIGTAAMAIMLGCVNLPYLAMDYDMGISNVLLQNLNSCFSKYKLQYQLTSGILSFMVFVYCVEYIYQNVGKTHDKYIEFGIKFICMVLAVNGLLCGIYHSTDITVTGLDSDVVCYDNKSHYMYAPYPDWDYLWSQESCGGWMIGSKTVKYLEKPLEEGGIFQNYNQAWLDVEIEEQNAVLYFMLSCQTEKSSQIFPWLDFFNHAKQTYRINEKINIAFSKVSENGIRYAVMPYTSELMEILKTNDFTLSLGDVKIDCDRLNCIVVW